MSIQHEEHGAISSFWSWAILIALCLAIIGWGLLNYLLIPDPPRAWDMGVLRDVPGQSIYSTAEPPPAGAVPKQITPLPEAAPVSAADRQPGRLPRPVHQEPRP